MPTLRRMRVRVPPGPGREYPVVIGNDLEQRCAREIRDMVGDVRMFVLSDENVWRIWGERLVQALHKERISFDHLAIPEGEKSKTWATAGEVLGRMKAFGLDRESVLVAFGGGVVGDLGNFAASVYMRGIRCLQLPTTLLAQVDSCLGGKTGVDLPTAKNAVGSFHQPAGIVVDTDFLGTLPIEEVRNGMAEVVKYGVIMDRDLLDLAAGQSRRLLNRDSAAPWPELVERCLKAKAGVVARDETDAGPRMILNFGHTVGHALEVCTDFALPHGQAVSVGMVSAARLGERLGVSEPGVASRVEEVLTHLGLPIRLPSGVAVGSVLEALRHDKKALSGKNRWVVIRRMGEAELLDEAPTDVVRSVLEGLTL